MGRDKKSLILGLFYFFLIKISPPIVYDGRMNIIETVNDLLKEAVKNGASDIHIDPTENSLRIRFRVDGILQEALLLPKELSPPVISRLKVLSGLRIDEHQISQDGRFVFQNNNDGNQDKEIIDIRLSIIPTYYGENAVLRLLYRKGVVQTLAELGFNHHNLDLVSNIIKRPSGMILSTGPTGSGKTTTLYTLLDILNNKEKSIVTIEDPIEYAVSGIEQIQVNHRSGLTFSNGLRAILRQDPDIIMVGEIRDEETAAIAINSALTGHLLLSTLHTNDSASAVPRLLDMGIESYLIAATLSLIIGQRLVRKICLDCRQIRRINITEAKAISEMFSENSEESREKIIKNREIYFGRGCEACFKTGFQGRLGLVEVISITSEIKEAILNKFSEALIRKTARQAGFVSMKEDGFIKALEGLTTISEVTRVIHG